MAQENYNYKFNENSGSEGVSKKAADLKSKLEQGGKDFANEVSDKAKKVGTQAAHATDSMISSVGQGMSNLADKIRDNAPAEGKMGSAVDTVAEGLETGGKYLSEHKVDDIAKDVTEVVRKYPVSSLWIGLGVGVLLGCAFSRKS